MQEMTKDEQIAVMQAKIDEMTSAIFAKDRIWQLRTQMAEDKEWYNRPWYKKLAWEVKLMFS